MDLSIEDAVARARDKNIDIAVARITPRLTDFSIAGLEANYRVNLTAARTSTAIDAPADEHDTGYLAGHDRATRTTRGRRASRRTCGRGGGNYTVTLDEQPARPAGVEQHPQPARSTRRSREPTSSRCCAASRSTTTRASLQTNRITQTNDEITLQSTVATTVANARNAYWDLVFAIQAVEAAQNSLDISNKLVQDNQARVEIGTLAPIDVRSAEAEAANRRLTLVQAQATVRTVGAGAEAADRQRHRRSAVDLVDQPGRSSRGHARSRSTSTRRWRARSGERTDLQQSINNLKISDINLQQPGRSDPAAAEPDGQLRAAPASAARHASVRDPITGHVPQRHSRPAISTRCATSAGSTRRSGPSADTSRIRSAAARRKRPSRARSCRSSSPQANLKALQLQIATDVPTRR